jgi:hypothetical protein
VEDTKTTLWGRERSRVSEKQLPRWDIEDALDEQHLSQVRFGRSRFLRVLSLGLFGLATGLVAAPQRASAAPATSPSCGSLPRCSSCSGDGRCNPGIKCTKSNSTCKSRDFKGQVNCWFSSIQRPDGSYDQWKCCDWYEHGSNHCVCAGYVGIT